MSNTINNGGPAFPTENARQTGPSSWHEEGMTLRDYFAAKAMQAAISSKNCPESFDGSVVATASYAMADAMLRARGEA